jgi:hypothetical protein
VPEEIGVAFCVSLLCQRSASSVAAASSPGQDVGVVDASSVEVLEDADPLAAAVAVSVDEADAADELAEESADVVAEALGPVGEEDGSMLAVGVVVAEVLGVVVGVPVGVVEDADALAEADVLLGAADVVGAAGLLVDELEDGAAEVADPVLDAAALDVVVRGG